MRHVFSTIAAAVLLLGCSNLRVTTEGLGSGSVVSDPPGIDCGDRCARSLDGRSVTLRAIEAPGSVFAGWRGGCAGAVPSCVLPGSGQHAAAARFELRQPLVPLPPDELTPEGIQRHLAQHPQIDSPARFIAAIESQRHRFKDNWILMARSESLQTGHAASPRLLLPSDDATTIFAIALTRDPAFPHADPQRIEMIQFDGAARRFRFHEIDLARRSVSRDDERCAHCHHGRPNWDAYDSWGGMLPFNRDRFYKGSVETAALRRTLNLMEQPAAVRAVLEQLNLPTRSGQPVIVRGTGSGPAFGAIGFPLIDDDPTGAAVVLQEPRVGSLPGLSPIVADYPPDPAPRASRGSTVLQGPPVAEPQRGFFRLLKPTPGDGDEGRGVDLFDQLTPMNMQRIAGELIDASRPEAGRDLRPIALAIARGCADELALRLPAEARSFLDVRNGLDPGLPALRGLQELRRDTLARRALLPTLKADLQAETLRHERGLFAVHGAGTAEGTAAGVARVRQELYRRVAAPHRQATGQPARWMIDREETLGADSHVADYRYFLEPFGVAVDKWSMGVMGRSRTYTFGDYFGRDEQAVLLPALEASMRSSGWTVPTDCRGQVDAALSQLRRLPDPDGPPSVPEVRRVLARHCVSCHGLFARSGGTTGRSPGGPVAPDLLGSLDALRPWIVPGRPQDSRLMQLLRHAGGVPAMPPVDTGPPLGGADIDVLRRHVLAAAR